MASPIVLNVTKKEPLPNDTFIYQTDDCTIFYYYYWPPHRLYVKWQGREINAELLDKEESITSVIVHANAFYFVQEKKIYKAVFTPSNIVISHIRYVEESESIDGYGFISHTIEGKSYVYRIYDDPETDKILVDVPDEELKDVQLRLIHRKKAFYCSQNGNLELPNVRNLTSNIVVIQRKLDYRMYARESSPIVFLCNGNNIHSLNTETLEFLPPIRIEDTKYIFEILGVYNGEITVWACIDGVWHSVTAKLPKEYYIETPPVHGAQLAIVKERVKEFEAAKDEWAREKEELIKNSTEKLAEVLALKEQMEEDFNATIDEQSVQIQTMQASIDKLCNTLTEVSARECHLLVQNKKQLEEIAMLKTQITDLDGALRESKIGALLSVNKLLKLQELENLSKPLICIQLDNGTILYFDNVKPFELFIIVNGIRKNADLAPLGGEFDCSFKGSSGNQAYFRSIRGKSIKFFQATVENETINLEQINEMKTSEISLFNNQPLYFVELAKEWSVYPYHEKHTEKEGEKYDISEINHLSKYERFYHRGILYLFRENSTATIEKVNDKVVRVEGPLIEEGVISFYSPSNSDSIYILNPDYNVLLILNTSNLTVSQLCYEPPADANNHSIVGIHNGVLTMAFDGVWGRHLFTTTLP